jgi:hypothetical protein
MAICNNSEVFVSMISPVLLKKGKFSYVRNVDSLGRKVSQLGAPRHHALMANMVVLYHL